MKIKLLTLIMAILLLNSCSGNSLNTSKQESSLPTTEHNTIRPSATSEPAITPTPIPSETPAPATQEPKALEDYEYNESTYAYSGSGDDVITGVTIEFLSKLRFVSNNDRHKSITSHYTDGKDLLVNTVGPYDGFTLLWPGQEYTLEINANGDWTIEIFNLGSSSTDTFTGYGDFVTPIFTASSDIYEITAEGERHFAILGYSDHGRDLLVNTTDDYSGKVMFKTKGQVCLFEITGEREWSIQPVD